MIENNLYNRISSDLLVVYIKKGVQREQNKKIFCDSFIKELTFIEARNNTSRVSKLAGKKEKEFADEIVADKLMDSEQNYHPKERSADEFRYGLFIILSHKSNFVKWTDALGTFPDGHSKFTTFIENMKPVQ